MTAPIIPAPTIPNLPPTWDKILFIIGVVFIFFYQANKWFILIGVGFIGIGAIIGLAELVVMSSVGKSASDDEVKSAFVAYLMITLFVLFILELLLGVIIFSK